MKDDGAGDGDAIEAWLAVTAGPAGPDAPDAAAAGGPRRGPLPRRLLALSVLPWIVAALLGATALQGQVLSAPSVTAPTTAATAPATGSPAPPEPAPAAADEGGGAADAAAVVALRTAATEDEYIDTTAVESRSTAGGLTIVTVRAVRLVRSAGAWGEPQVIRAAVATAKIGGESIAVAAPWRLPAPAAPAAAPQWMAVDDPALLKTATAAVRAAGYRRIGQARLRRANALGDVVSLALTAAAPGDQDARAHEILLTADAAAVLGASAADPLPLPIPAEQP